MVMITNITELSDEQKKVLAEVFAHTASSYAGYIFPRVTDNPIGGAIAAVLSPVSGDAFTKKFGEDFVRMLYSDDAKFSALPENVQSARIELRKLIVKLAR